jgi:hypothetical protein
MHPVMNNRADHARRRAGCVREEKKIVRKGEKTKVNDILKSMVRKSAIRENFLNRLPETL